MTQDPSLPSLDPDIAALLGRERSDPAFAAGKERLARRLEIAAVAAAAGASLAGPRALAGAGAAGGAGLSGGAVSGLASRLLRAALLVGIGGVVGATVQAQRDRPATTSSAQSAPAALPSPVSVPRVAPPSAGAALPDPTKPGASSEPVAPAVPVVDVSSLPLARARVEESATASARSPTAAASSSASARSSTSLGEEQRLLDTARTAVGRGAFAAALATLDEHEARFPDGRLLEERELLQVQALSGAGREGEAKERAARFEARFPASIFLPAVRAALDTRPR